MITVLMSRAYRKALVKRLSGFSACLELPEGGRAEWLLSRAMFMVLGRLAKADGRVTEKEVHYASDVMKRMALCGEKRQQAIEFYEKGKHPESNLSEAVIAAAKVLKKRSALAKLFLQIQCEAAYLKGGLRLKDRIVLRDVAEQLGYSKSEFLAIASAIRSEHYQRAEAGSGFECAQFQGRSFLWNAYRVLQLEPGAKEGEIRRAYLRMMSRNHPDKLANSNLSEAALRQAQENVMAIRNAYEALCGFKKIRA